MHWLLIAWVVFALVRWGLPWIWESVRRPERAPSNWLQQRGRVFGHRGPHVRSFSGRAGRREWWLGFAWNSIAGGFVGAIPTIGPLLSLPWLIAGLALNARRLHDLQQSAWLQLVPMGFAAAALAANVSLTSLGLIPDDFDLVWSNPVEAAYTGVVSLALIVYLAFYAWLGLIEGTRGPNCYGEADIPGAPRTLPAVA